MVKIEISCQLDPSTIPQSALDSFIHAWELRTLPKAEFTHAAHVAVCAYYHHNSALPKL